MRRTTLGVINLTALLTVISVLLGFGNVVQSVYTINYYRANEKADALNLMDAKNSKDKSDFENEYRTSVTVMRAQVDKLYLPDAGTLRASIEEIASDGSAMKEDVTKREQYYKSAYDKSYQLESLDWVNQDSLSTQTIAVLRQRYDGMKRKGNFEKVRKLFAFAAAVQPSWVRRTTTESVNVRMTPNPAGQVVGAIPANSACTAMSVSPDQSWIEISAKAPNPIQGWVYVRFLIPGKSYIF